MAHHFAFDLGRRLTGATDPAATYDYEYDRLDRLVGAEVDVAGLNPNVFFELAYDKSSNRTKLAVDVGTLEDFVNDYAYDDLNRLKTVTQQAQSDNAVAEKRVDFSYNLAGQFDTITRRAGLLTTSPTVATTSYEYDLAGRLTGIGHFGPSLSPYIAHEYEYDQANRITSYIYARTGGGLSSANRTATFDYDARDQLIEDDRASTSNDRTYTYDDNGNRTAVNSTAWDTDPNNQLTDDGTFTYGYDDEGNRTSRTKISDDTTTRYVWDHRNRLVEVAKYATSTSTTATHRVSYAYDAFDQRIRKALDADGDGSGTASETFFVWDNGQIVLEFDDTGSSDISHRYLYGPAVDQILADEQVTSTSTAGTVLWPLADNLGSVRDLVEYHSGTGTTTIANSIDYDAFGRRISQSNGAVDHLFAYTGRDLDEDTGLQYHRGRWYDAIVGRWLSEDPIGFAGGDANLARYVANATPSSTDPSGRVLVAIDGTGSKHFREEENGFDEKTGRYRSHVRNFYEDYQRGNNERKAYFDGPSWEWTGMDCQKIMNGAMKILKQELAKDPSQPINIIGYSRGGYIAMQIVNELKKMGYKVNFVALLDPVDSAPGFGECDRLPSNAQHAFQVRCHASVSSRWYFNRVDSWPDIEGWQADDPRNWSYGTHAAVGGAPWDGDHPAGLTKEEDEAESERVGGNLYSAAQSAGVSLKPPP